jgi:hypothetical protein
VGQSNRRRRRNIDCSSHETKLQLAEAGPCEMKFEIFAAFALCRLGSGVLLLHCFCLTSICLFSLHCPIPAPFSFPPLPPLKPPNCFSFPSLQTDNSISIAATCRLIACIQHNPNLTNLSLDYEPSACIAHAAWQGEALPMPHDATVREGCDAVLQFLRVRRVCAQSAAHAM